MGKHRVYEIAKELGKTNQEVIDILAKNNDSGKKYVKHCRRYG